MNMLQCYANGAVVFNAEHPFYCTGVNDKASWALKESILPAFRYITEKPAASRDAVAAEIKAGIFTSNKTYLPQNYAAGLYGNTSDTNILQYSGRYRVLPLFTNRVQESDVPAHIWNNKLYVSDFNGKTDAYKQGKLNPLYPEVSTGDAFVETLLGGNERWLVMNSSFNDNTNQTAGIIPATAAFASSMNFTLTPHTYLVVEQDTDSLSIELNNFRTDKDELSSIDGVSFPQVPRKLAHTKAAFAELLKQLCGDGLQDSFCIFVAVRIFLAERVAASARLLQSSQQCFLCAFQHRQRIKHRRCAHLAAGQQDTAPTGRQRRHWGHCCQLAFRSHFRFHIQLQPEHCFCLFHALSF